MHQAFPQSTGSAGGEDLGKQEENTELTQNHRERQGCQELEAEPQGAGADLRGGCPLGGASGIRAPAWEAIPGTDHGPTAHQPGHDPADGRPSGACVLRPSWDTVLPGRRPALGAPVQGFHGDINPPWGPGPRSGTVGQQSLQEPRARAGEQGRGGPLDLEAQ